MPLDRREQCGDKLKFNFILLEEWSLLKKPTAKMAKVQLISSHVSKGALEAKERRR